MITVRPSEERGRANHGWLDARHTFSFAGYHDPEHQGFRSLRVINEDRIRGGAGFGMHPHQDMEIVTYLLSGALEHQDSKGNRAVLRPGELQYMSAGRGILHSEFNHSATEEAHLLQIWIQPAKRGLEPVYAEKAFPPEERRNRLQPLASHDGREGSITIQQDAVIYGTLLDAGKSVELELSADRYAWIQVARGALTVNGASLRAGDGAAVQGETRLTLTAETADQEGQPAELLLFDLA